MLNVFSEWFGQGVSVPVIAFDVAFVFIGLTLGLKFKELRTVLYCMAGAVVLFLIATPVSLSSVNIVSMAGVFFGAIALFILIGFAAALAVKLLKKQE